MAFTKSIGLHFPLRDDTRGAGSFFDLTTTVGNAVRSNLLLLVTTRRGTRWRRPTYGCSQLHRLFDPNDSVTLEEIKLDVRQSVELWLPGVTISEITSTQDARQLKLQLYFEYTEGALRKREVLDVVMASPS